jgi:hypothetical protein
MKAEHVETQETTEEVSVHGVEKLVQRRKSRRSARCAREKPNADCKKETCESVEQEVNHEKGPRWSWARNQMGNPLLIAGLLVLATASHRRHVVDKGN